MIDLNQQQCICIIGAGGKTTLMKALMKKYAHKKMLITTTVHMEKPDCIIVEDASIDEVDKAFKHSNTLACVYPAARGVVGFDLECLKQLYSCCDLMLIEADGNHNHPFKLDREHEPVLVDFMTLGIAVLSMSAYGKTFKEAAYPAEYSAKMCHRSVDDRINSEDFILAARQLVARFKEKPAILLLNRITKENIEAAEVIRAALAFPVLFWYEGESEYEENSLCI